MLHVIFCTAFAQHLHSICTAFAQHLHSIFEHHKKMRVHCQICHKLLSCHSLRRHLKAHQMPPKSKSAYNVTGLGLDMSLQFRDMSSYVTVPREESIKKQKMDQILTTIELCESMFNNPTNSAFASSMISQNPIVQDSLYEMRKKIHCLCYYHINV